MTTAETMQDRLAIRELVSSYAAAASRKDVAALQALFVDDARVCGVAQAVEGGDDLIGRAAIGGFFGRMFEQVESVTQMPHTADVRVTGDTASASCDIVEYVKYGGAPGFVIVVAHYDDSFRRTEGGWRFALRRFTMRIMSQVPEAAS
jgi:uncharacterized protein (TIGR02246 family)